MSRYLVLIDCTSIRCRSLQLLPELRARLPEHHLLPDADHERRLRIDGHQHLQSLKCRRGKPAQRQQLRHHRRHQERRWPPGHYYRLDAVNAYVHGRHCRPLIYNMPAGLHTERCAQGVPSFRTTVISWSCLRSRIVVLLVLSFSSTSRYEAGIQGAMRIVF